MRVSVFGVCLLAAAGADAFAFGPSAAPLSRTSAALRSTNAASGRVSAPLGLRMAGDKAEIDFGKVGFDEATQVCVMALHQAPFRVGSFPP